MTETLPFQHGMTLGRTYDLRRHTIGPDIFPEDYTANPKTNTCPSTRIKYQVIKKSSDVNDVLDVSGDISLKAKAGILKVQGMGSYLKDSRSEENALEILAVAHVETVCTTLMNPKLPNNWNKNTLGSHYIRSIIYGGDLIIKISYIASDSKEKEEIKANVEAGFQIESILDAEGRANVKKILQDLKQKSEIKFSYYCTTPCNELPRDVDSMLKALHDFPNQLAKINEGIGAPLRCELVPLTYLDPDFPKVLRQTGLETQMREFEDKYDDTRQSQAMLHSCLEDSAEYMTKEQGEKGDEIDNRIQTVMWRFNRVISTLDVTTDGDGLDQIQDAVDFYRTNKKCVNFRTEVKQFIKEVQPHITTRASGPVNELPKGESLSILLVGVTGHGKSATANSIFGEKMFDTHIGSESVWNICLMKTGIIGGREVYVVDTPGSIYISTSGSKLVNHYDQELKELETAFKLRPRGYHAFLFVLSIDVRIRMGDLMAIEMLKKKFGHDILKNYGVIIFTHGDSFDRNMKKLKLERSFEEYINSEKGFRENVLKECNDRCALINNLEEDPGILRDQVINIITLIDGLVTSNNSRTYNWKR